MTDKWDVISSMVGHICLVILLIAFMFCIRGCLIEKHKIETFKELSQNCSIEKVEKIYNKMEK